MTEKLNVTSGTAEEIALHLLHIVADIEGRDLRPKSGATAGQSADRKWVLDTYDECLAVVTSRRNGMTSGRTTR